MTAPLHIGLPVALHNDGEIAAFQEARERIPALLRGYGIESDVSVFLYFTRALLKKERRERQLENQARLRLPILHAQTPVYSEDSLACDEYEQSCFGTHSLLEMTVYHTATLKALDPSGISCAVDTHAGVFVYDAPTPSAGVYNVGRFLGERTQVFEQVRERFDMLSQYAKKKGLGFLLENAMPAVVYPDRVTGEPHLHYLPFTDWRSFSRIGKGAHTFDIAHWAAADHLPAQFQRNGVNPATLFRILGVGNWDEYRVAIGAPESFTDTASAIHLSNTQGIGIGIDEYPELAARWGSSGTNDGLLSRETLRTCLLDAQAKGVPVMVEVDYDVKNILRNKYAEADSFLTHILRD